MTVTTLPATDPDTLRARLGRFGIWTDVLDRLPATQIRSVAVAVEQAGFGGLWIPEVTAGREASTLATLLLTATERLVVGNGILKMSARPPASTASFSRMLADAFPDRHVLGLGVGPVRPADGTPLGAAEKFLVGMDEARLSHPSATRPFRLLAAYGPAMLSLARRLTDGAMTYAVPVAHTRVARAALGPEPFLCVEQAVVAETDETVARAVARQHLDVYLRTPFNRAKFLRLGYTEADMADGGTDAIVDDLVIGGDAQAISDRLHAHLEAGADHVVVNVLGVDDADPTARWNALGHHLAGR